jgi:hypothetical protein
MNDPIRPGAAKECDNCPARGAPAAWTVDVQRQAPVPAMREETGAGGGEVVLTTAGHGTFLVRRRTAPPSTCCPLLGYEVVRIDADPGRPASAPDPDLARIWASVQS